MTPTGTAARKLGAIAGATPGCADGQLTAQGAGVAALFGIGAIALATLGSIGPVPRWRATAPA